MVAAAGCGDELLLAVAPVAAVESDVPASLEREPGFPVLPVVFWLTEVCQLHGV